MAASLQPDLILLSTPHGVAALHDFVLYLNPWGFGWADTDNCACPPCCYNVSVDIDSAGSLQLIRDFQKVGFSLKSSCLFVYLFLFVSFIFISGLVFIYLFACVCCLFLYLFVVCLLSVCFFICLLFVYLFIVCLFVCCCVCLFIALACLCIQFLFVCIITCDIYFIIIFVVTNSNF